MKQALPPNGTGAPTGPLYSKQLSGRRNVRIAVIVVVLILGYNIVHGIFSHHVTADERIAYQMTAALQKNDLDAVDAFQNAETKTEITRAIVGRAADTFAPLGALKTAYETSHDDASNTHQFDVTFDKGVVHETIKFDPDNKVVHFKYDQPVSK